MVDKVEMSLERVDMQKEMKEVKKNEDSKIAKIGSLEKQVKELSSQI